MNTGMDKAAIGLFGGTFDPVHQGHLALARHVRRQCLLDRVLFIPAPRPPHKGALATTFEQRVAMLELALDEAGEGTHMQCSRIEADLPAPSYTVQTVEALLYQGTCCTYFFIIGGDSLLDLPSWHRAADLLARVNLIVVQRDHLAVDRVGPMLRDLDPSFAYEHQGGIWRNQQGRTVRYIDDIELPVSSSQVREELARGQQPSMVAPSVFAYIRRHHLYGWKES
nr:nicotinate (nicotinamide) nucleotide adenylyltransferase [uncultured Desulfobulbus sp.]